MTKANDPFRNSKRDLEQAVIEVFEERFDPDEFVVDYHKSVPLNCILSHIKSSYTPRGLEPDALRDASENEVREELTRIEGTVWTERALPWVNEGFPAIVLVVIRSDIEPLEYILADGQRRVSFAQALGKEEIPILVVKKAG
jgi:hypothetical protein